MAQDGFERHGSRAAVLDAIGARLATTSHRVVACDVQETMERRVAAFERAHQISVPFEYRSFLTRFGERAPGLIPLPRPEDRSPPLLHRGCLLDPDHTRRDYDDHAVPQRGALPLTEGNPHALLVVSGARRGQVVSFDATAYTCEVAEHALTGPVDFLTWYAAWLDLTEGDPGRRTSGALGRFACGLLGSEEELVATLEDVYTEAKRRTKAVIGLAQRPTLGAAALEALDRAMHDPSPRVRLEALRGHQRHAAERFLERAAAVVKDDVAPQLRRATLSLLEQHGDPRRWQVIHEALGDRDPEVAMGALSVLLRARPTGQDLAALLEHPRLRHDARARARVVEALGESPGARAKVAHARHRP